MSAEMHNYVSDSEFETAVMNRARKPGFPKPIKAALGVEYDIFSCTSKPPCG